jgi:hypothetical protein
VHQALVPAFLLVLGSVVLGATVFHEPLARAITDGNPRQLTSGAPGTPYGLAHARGPTPELLYIWHEGQLTPSHWDRRCRTPGFRAGPTG